MPPPSASGIAAYPPTTAVPPVVTDIPCPKCESKPLNLRDGKRGPWLECSDFPKRRGREGFAKLYANVQKQPERDLAKHLKAHPMPMITRMDGRPIEDLVIPGQVQDLAVHPDAIVDTSPRRPE